MGSVRNGFLEHVHEARLNFSKLFSQTMHQDVELPADVRPGALEPLRDPRCPRLRASPPHRKCGQTDKKRGKDKKIKGSNGFRLAEQ
ncbi:MAG: hypothetical protein ACYC5H_11510 [Methylovirgula sp.]